MIRCPFPLLAPFLAIVAWTFAVFPEASAGTLEGVRSVKITNTREDWFYIEEVEMLNADDEDTASIDFGTTATANSGPAFGSTLEGAIDDEIGSCCATGWHSADSSTMHVYTITFPALQTLDGDITIWNRQDGCCMERLDGMLFEFFTGEDGAGMLLASVQVDNLATDSLGDINTETGAGFPVPDPFTDADGDGLPGIWETEHGLNPDSAEGDDGADGDPDADGLKNSGEFEAGTDPRNADSDGDKLSDGVETGTGIYVSAEDTGTDPLVADTDKDGIADGAETKTGTYVSAADTGTHPLLGDSDDDGLLDGVETNTGIFVDRSDTGTDPNKSDSDGDNVSDGLEVAAGSDPNDATSRPEPGGTIAGVVTVVITNTREDWFYIEEVEFLNREGTDVASLDAGATAEATPGTFGSSVDGGIDDAIANCCSSGWHSEQFNGDPQTYTITFPEPQVLTGLARIWNRQDGCCSERLDGLIIEYFDENAELIVSQEVIELASNSEGGISSESGASFPLASGGSLAPFEIISIVLDTAAKEATITWNSSPATTYALEVADNLTDWIEVDDGIQGQPDSETTTYTEAFDVVPAERYYRLIIP